jgi:preprotein translocase subunit YajC
MGTLILANASQPASKGSPAFSFILLAAAVVLFYMLFMRPQRNRQRRARQQQGQIVPGQRIRTTAGIYGTVISGDDRDVVIEVAPGVQITMLRRAVMEVVPDDDMVTEPDAPQDSADEPEAEPEPEADDAPPAGEGLDLKKDTSS